MPFIDFFNFQPKNELEKGGRQSAPIAQDDNEPAKTCPNCHRQIPLSQLWGNDQCCTNCN